LNIENQKESTLKRSELSLSTQSTTKHSQISFKDLVIEQKIGKGSYGKVCLGKWNAASVALKFCRQKERIEDFMREIRLMMYVLI
jgi:serine/threonine protein kinase